MGQIREINAGRRGCVPPIPFSALSPPCREAEKVLYWSLGGEVGEGRVHTEDTFSVPLGSFQPGWPTSPTLWPGSLSERAPSCACALAGPHWPPLALWIFLRGPRRKAWRSLAHPRTVLSWSPSPSYLNILNCTFVPKSLDAVNWRMRAKCKWYA